MNHEVAKKLIQFITTHMARESALLRPPGTRNVFMTDPYALLDLIREEAKLTHTMVDGWMLETQER